MSFLSRRKVLNVLFGGAVGAATGAVSFGMGEDADRPSGERKALTENVTDSRDPMSLRQYLGSRHFVVEPEKLDRIADDFDRWFLISNTTVASLSGLATIGLMQTETLEGMLKDGDYQAYFVPFLSNVGFFEGVLGTHIGVKAFLEDSTLFAERYGIKELEASYVQFTLASYFSNHPGVNPAVTATLVASGVNEAMRRLSGVDDKVKHEFAQIETPEGLRPRGPWDA